MKYLLKNSASGRKARENLIKEVKKLKIIVQAFLAAIILWIILTIGLAL